MEVIKSSRWSLVGPWTIVVMEKQKIRVFCWERNDSTCYYIVYMEEEGTKGHCQDSCLSKWLNDRVIDFDEDGLGENLAGRLVVVKLKWGWEFSFLIIIFEIHEHLVSKWRWKEAVGYTHLELKREVWAWDENVEVDQCLNCPDLVRQFSLWQEHWSEPQLEWPRAWLPPTSHQGGGPDIEWGLSLDPTGSHLSDI